MNQTATLALTAFLLVSGCATTTHGVSSDYTFTEDGTTGLVAYSTRLDDHCGAAMRLAALRVEGATAHRHVRRELIVANPLVKQDFEDPPGYFICAAVGGG